MDVHYGYLKSRCKSHRLPLEQRNRSWKSMAATPSSRSWRGAITWWVPSIRGFAGRYRTLAWYFFFLADRRRKKSFGGAVMDCFQPQH